MENIKRIYTLLLHSNGLKIKEIAKELDFDKYYVADILFSTDCIPYWYQNDSSSWFAKEGAIEVEKATHEDEIPQVSSRKQIFDVDKYMQGESSETLRMLLAEISNYRLCSSSETNELFVRYRSGDMSAYELIAKSHMRLVANIGRLYKHKGLPYEDIIQEGCLGLTKAIQRFDHTRNIKFSTFAKGWILQAITNAIVNLPSMVRLPMNAHAEHRQIRNRIEQFLQENHYFPSVCDVDNEKSEFNWISYLYNYPDKHYDIIEDNIELDEIADCEICADSKLMHESLAYELQSLLDFLPSRHRDIINMYFGLIGMDEHTYYHIADRLWLTRERVRQIVATSIRELSQLYHMKYLTYNNNYSVLNNIKETTDSLNAATETFNNAPTNSSPTKLEKDSSPIDASYYTYKVEKDWYLNNLYTVYRAGNDHGLFSVASNTELANALRYRSSYISKVTKDDEEELYYIIIYSRINGLQTFNSNGKLINDI